MGQRERLKRANPQRTEPIRDWSNMYRTSEPLDSGDLQLNPLGNGSSNQAESSEAAHRGVELGYTVLDKHIREGHSAAQQHRRSSVFQAAERAGLAQADTDKIIERTFRAISDLLPLWRELLNSVVAASLVRTSSRDQNGAAATSKSASDTGAVAVELSSPRPVRVTIALTPGYESRVLVMGGLHAVDSQKPSIEDVDFIPARSGQRGCMRIRVSADQPSGVYAAVVLDKESEEPCGTLTIRIA
jgi:hypothetical protein